ncbi:MAG: MATE family efflux transporter [Treponema sp.]|nr:MATE family efflux transporter [Treponema sp.]
MEKEELFERMPVTKAIFKLTIPVIISSIISIVYNLSDTYFVGMINDPVQNAAVTLVGPAMVLFFAVTNLFGIGASSLMSRKLGEKNYDDVKKASATGLYLGLFCAIFITTVTLLFNPFVLKILGSSEITYEVTKDYLFWTVGLGAVPGIMNLLFSFIIRAEGRAIQASVGAMSGCILNIILDPFFILPFGLNMGAAGAGLATFISNTFACVYFLVLLFIIRKNTLVSLNPKHFTLRPDIIKNIFVVGIPGVFQNLLNVTGMTILNNLASGYGTDLVASMGIVGKMNQIPIQVIFGFSQGIMPLIGYNYASKNIKRVKETISKEFKIILGLIILIIVTFICCGKPIVRMFMDNDNIVTIGARFLIGTAISLPFMSFDFVTVGISQSFGIGKVALVFSFLRKAFLEIPFIFLFSHLFGMYGLAFPAVGAEFIMSIIAFVVLVKILNNLKTE